MRVDISAVAGPVRIAKEPSDSARNSLITDNLVFSSFPSRPQPVAITEEGEVVADDARRLE